jgi:opacity protein-like surface antigen
MKKLLTTTALFTAISASTTAIAATPYIEGALGYAKARDVDTDPYSYTSGGNTVSETYKLDYDSSAMFGAEFGFKDVLVPNLRIGVAIATMKFDLNSAQLTKTINNGITTTTTTENLTGDRLVANGLHFDSRINLYMLNAYYDFKNTTAFTPFVGFGIGVADIRQAKDQKFAYTLDAGAKYHIDKNIYLAAKAAYTRIDGPTDRIGIRYHDLDLYTANILVGYEF